jgi:nucleoside phosphorylase
MTTARATYDLGLIIPTREEFDYLRRSVPFRPITDVDKGYWYEFTVPGQRWGVAHVLFDMGLVATTAATGKLLNRFHPEVLAVVGIGGGLSPKLRLGDVVVGSVIQEYMKAAKIASDPASGPVILPSGESWPLPEKLRNFTNHFEYFAAADYQSWLRFAQIRAVEDAIPLATTPGARREPSYFVLPIASGDFVVADPVFKDWLISFDRMRSVVEMESAGAARAVKEYDQDVSLIVLRGISDFADQQKAKLDPVVFGGTSGAWRCYASQNAIELLLAFLASPDFPWRTPNPPRPRRDPSALALPADFGPAPGEPATGRAWSHFMAVVPVIQAATGVAGLLHTLLSDHHHTVDAAPHDPPEPDHADHAQPHHGHGAHSADDQVGHHPDAYPHSTDSHH